MRANEIAGWAVALAGHTFIVYACAVHLSPWLVARSFAWLLPMLEVTPRTPPGDWYLQHLELMSIVPAFVFGCVNLLRFLPVVRNLINEGQSPVGIWAWTVPTVILGYKMLQYHAPYSVLTGTLMSPFRYYFEIQRIMPNRTNFLSIDGARVLAQMLITAPFYAGVAYSLGAWVWRRVATSRR